MKIKDKKKLSIVTENNDHFHQLLQNWNNAHFLLE